MRYWRADTAEGMQNRQVEELVCMTWLEERSSP